MGPLALTDLVGLDTVKSIADSMYEEFKEPLYLGAAAAAAHGRGGPDREEVGCRLLLVLELRLGSHRNLDRLTS